MVQPKGDLRSCAFAKVKLDELEWRYPHIADLAYAELYD